MIRLGDLLDQDFITYPGYIKLHYEDRDGKHKILCKFSDLKFYSRYAKFKSYSVSNINLDTFTITLMREEKK